MPAVTAGRDAAGSPSILGGSGKSGVSIGMVGCVWAGGGVKARAGFRNQHELDASDNPTTTGRKARTPEILRNLSMPGQGGELKAESSPPVSVADELDSTIMQLHRPVSHR